MYRENLFFIHRVFSICSSFELFQWDIDQLKLFSKISVIVKALPIFVLKCTYKRYL